MTDLSMVSYRGIPLESLHGTDGPVMMFNFYWFPNAFGWECPSCPAHIQNGWYVHLGGVSYVGPRRSFDPVAYMRQAAQDMKMPTSIYDCIPFDGKIGHEKCSNYFFDALRATYATRYILKIGWGRFMWYMLSLFYGLAALWGEFCIKNSPHRMKCSCRWQWQRMFCAQPKGTNEEIEALNEHAWDRMRLWAYSKAFVFFLVPAAYDLWCSREFINYLNTVEKEFPGGQSMNASLGRPFLFLSWTNVLMSGAASFLIYKKWQLTRTSGNWDERRSLEDLRVSETESLAGRGEEGDDYQWADGENEDDVLPSSINRIDL
ncbi:hypothetical protein EsH8_I_001504 [Colletotrichum jinshuiense]